MLRAEIKALQHKLSAANKGAERNAHYKHKYLGEIARLNKKLSSVTSRVVQIQHEFIPALKPGTRVYKTGSDQRFSGVVVSAFQKLDGKVRYVVENQDGILHIGSDKNFIAWDASTQPTNETLA